MDNLIPIIIATLLIIIVTIRVWGKDIKKWMQRRKGEISS